MAISLALDRYEIPSMSGDTKMVKMPLMKFLLLFENLPLPSNYPSLNIGPKVNLYKSFKISGPKHFGSAWDEFH